MVGLKLDASRSSQGIVLVDWRILERNDGASIQIIYAGSPQVKLAVDGVIEGQPRILSVHYPGEIKDATAQVETTLLPLWVKLFSSAVAFVLLMYGFALAERVTAKRALTHRWRTFLLRVCFMSAMAGGVFALISQVIVKLFALPSPPFSF